MCGLAGEIRFDGVAVDIAALERMTQQQSDRGPDSFGMAVTSGRGFGHRRLKIMDLSDAAQQPMVDPQLGLGVVFNGAIYNHADLRRELQAMGYVFYSQGDTEVLLKAYHAWGASFVERLNGMFAFALWSRDSGRVLLGRDRLGIKPLYYAEVPGGLRFASTLPALLAGGGIDTSIDPVGLHHYLSFHAVVPAPYTLLNGVRKLAPGTLMHIAPDGQRSESTYWSLDYARSAEAESRSFDDWKEILLDSLRLAVRRRLVGDVPVGALLSGGVDSSLIVGLMVEAGVQGLRTYNVGFEDVGGEKGNEFEYADIVAQRFGTVHERIFVPEAQLLRRLPEAIRAMSEPMVSHDCIGFYLLSEAVSRHSKVVQSGQGADEVFGGYHWYPKLQDSAQPVPDYLAAFRDRDHAEYRRTVQDRYLTTDASAAFVDAQFAAPGAPDPVEKALRMDTTVMLVDDPVKRVDNMTMAFGLEARVPFLDHELVELAARIPARHKLAGGGKGILKEAARQVIPDAVIDRPKGYFPVPGLKYLQGDVLANVRDALCGRAARERGLFRQDYVDQLLADPGGHITPLRGSKLWQLGLLEQWLQTHVPA
ncbi:MAG: N-acetylglutaminylglutamine amidotransferase [Gammaproteobacteria bacterium]|jgi:asparagine synthase (glutamine-hydrolysing)|nr:N-acetylglutaminylglutamine amidotransferase [Gammaproteobacteria bacterium]MBU0828868.1 N-acetylglutaminylglutamine amidotransferase [Gammaproteobacteria bacterium]MBU1815205.1 N-acetylglutaminylglutamine amidotransferase [Gammaproteobacteria bacterium]